VKVSKLLYWGVDVVYSVLSHEVLKNGGQF